VSLTLKTANYREAEHLASVVDIAFDRFFESHVDRDLDEKLRSALQRVLTECLASELRKHQVTPHNAPLYD
jgi:hypothetical protein